jgi:outer membrane protein TolC
LTGSLRLARVTLTALCTPARRFWSVGPTRSWPTCDTGRIRAHIAVQEAQTAPQRRAYAQTVLQTLEEVENARVASSREQARRTRLADAVAAHQ